MTRPLDVLVVGAGPAGCAAAITAAERGLAVTVVDKAEFPRDKTCGDGLTTAALRWCERLGLSLDAMGGVTELARVHETVLVSPSGRHVYLPLPRDGVRAAVVQRANFDAALVAIVRDRGVDVREGEAVSDVVIDVLGAKVRLADGTALETRHVVAADGHWSAVRRSLHPDDPPDLGEWHAARQYFTGVRDDRLWVTFDRDLLPGYAWVFPLPGGRANVGFGVLRSDGRSGKELQRLWPRVLAQSAIREALGRHAHPEGTVRAWPIPTRYEPSALADGLVLYAGDAARVVDPMTGEGIAQAFETGALAVDAIAAGGDATAVAARYRDSVDRALGRDLRFASLLQRLLARPLGARGAVRAAGLTPWTRRNFARWLFEDYPRALVLTPDRWRRGMFTPPGPYR